MALKRKLYDSWSRGEFGVLSPSKATEGQFTGVDVLNYNSGLVGPRAGLVPTGWTVGAGQLAGFDLHSPDSPYDYWCVAGTQVYLMTDGTSSVVTASGVLAGTPTAPVQGVAVATTIYLSNYNDKLYTVTGSTLASVASSPGGKCLVLFGERLMMASTGTSTKNRVRYSDANAFSTWDPLGFFDVGHDGAITGMWVVRNQVWISKDNGEWWVYSGVPGETDALRLAYKGVNYPLDFRCGALNGLQLWYVGVEDDFPSYFNGNQITQLDELLLPESLYAAPTGLETGVMVANLPRQQDLVIFAGANVAGSERRTLVQKNGVWTRHSPIANWGLPRAGVNGSAVVTDGGGTSGNARFWYWRVTAPESPPVLSTELTDSGSEFVAELGLPEFVEKEGKDFRVQQVIVEYRKYSPDTETPNKIVATVRAGAQWNNYEVVSSRPLGFAELPDEDDVLDGALHRVRIAVGDQGYGGSAQVILTGLQGVAIERIYLEYDESKARP